MAKRLSVILSQGQSQNPVKRQLEEDIVTALLMENGIDVTVIPDLYHLTLDGTAVLALQGVAGDMVVVSWMYERAARWILDRNQIRGHEGETLLVRDDDDDEDDEPTDSAEEDPKERVIDSRDLPQRHIFSIDLRVSTDVADYVTEIKRIAGEINTQVVELGDWIQGSPTPSQQERFERPTNDTAVGTVHAESSASDNGDNGDARSIVKRLEEQGDRRWYPVIDFSRCTNCMECIDFCLFGVYGVDAVDTILVEQPDNCRKGCPACSRVCPENAIIFPQHKTPAIAGSAADVGSLKIDLSRLFGAPDGDAVEVAARERDEQLVLAGRDAVGMSVGIPKRQADKEAAPKDDLDDLLDELDDLDL
jgi:hypothetical protein